MATVQKVVAQKAQKVVQKVVPRVVQKGEPQHHHQNAIIVITRFMMTKSKITFLRVNQPAHNLVKTMDVILPTIIKMQPVEEIRINWFLKQLIVDVSKMDSPEYAHLNVITHLHVMKLPNVFIISVIVNTPLRTHYYYC